MCPVLPLTFSIIDADYRLKHVGLHDEVDLCKTGTVAGFKKKTKKKLQIAYEHLLYILFEMCLQLGKGSQSGTYWIRAKPNKFFSLFIILIILVYQMA